MTAKRFRPAGVVLGLLFLGVLLGAAQAPAPSLTSGLIAHWKLDETTGTLADDSAGANDGTHTGGPTITTTGLPPAIKFTNQACLSFDGVDDYVVCGTSANLAPAKMTVSFWTKNLVAPAQFDGLLGKTEAVNWSQGWGFYYNSATEIDFFVGAYDGSDASATINPTQWNHIVGTWDGVSVNIYVNTVPGVTDPYAGAPDAGTYPMELGRVGGNSYNINGLLDDVRVYNRVLSTQEITLLYQGYNGPPAAPTGLTATPATGQVSLTWNASAQATSYTIRRSPTGSNYQDIATGVTSTNYVNTGLYAGTYYYVVAAVNALGPSPDSSPATAVVTGPPAPPPGASGSGDKKSRCGFGAAEAPVSGTFWALMGAALAGLLILRRPA